MCGLVSVMLGIVMHTLRYLDDEYKHHEKKVSGLYRVDPQKTIGFVKNTAKTLVKFLEKLLSGTHYKTIRDTNLTVA